MSIIISLSDLGCVTIFQIRGYRWSLRDVLAIALQKLSGARTNVKLNTLLQFLPCRFFPVIILKN